MGQNAATSPFEASMATAVEPSPACHAAELPPLLQPSAMDPVGNGLEPFVLQLLAAERARVPDHQLHLPEELLRELPDQDPLRQRAQELLPPLLLLGPRFVAGQVEEGDEGHYGHEALGGPDEEERIARPRYDQGGHPEDLVGLDRVRVVQQVVVALRLVGQLAVGPGLDSDNHVDDDGLQQQVELPDPRA